MLTAVTLAVVGLTFASPQAAEAAVVQWGTNGGTSPNYQANVNGDFIMAGNGVLACTGNTGSTLINGTCTELHAASSSNPDNVNDNFIMTNANTVAGFSSNSSSAVVNVPAGATVVKAFLSWSANTGVYTGDSRVLCSSYSLARGTATLPAGGATGYASRAVQLRVGGGNVANIAPQNVLVDPTSQATARYYSASADVTSAFAGVATGSNVTVSAGNIWAPTGAGCYAGWSITVVYDFGTYIAGNPASAPHNVIFYEGHVRQGASDPDLTVAFNGFTAVAPGTRAGFTLFEGDRNITGDTASYARGGSSTYSALANPAGGTNNIGIGRAAGSVRYFTGSTAFTNQSVDVAAVPLPNVVAGDSTVNLRLGTDGDSFLLRNAVLSVPTAGLQLDKTYDGTADSQARTAGELATFTIRLTNTGAGTLRNIVVQDDQADCSRALTGVSLAPLQSTTFTCVAAAPSATGYTSTANATAYTTVGNYLAQATDSTTVLLSAIALEKTSALAPGATGRAGDVLTYTFTVTNTGQATLTGVVITDPLPGLSPIVFGAWPGPAGTLTAGQSVAATATYTLRQSDADAGSVANTATVRATDPDGGVQPSDTGNRVTPIASAAAISVTKAGSLPAGASGRVGDRIDYTFTFRNTGNVTLANASLVDPLPGLSPPTITWPTGTAGSLPVGQTATATATYTITQADVDAGFVRNTATVTARTPSGTTATATSAQVQVATIASAPGLSTTKSGTITSGTGGVGSTITYSFMARNTGNTTLTSVAIVDPLPGLSALSYTWPGTAGRLAPGQSATATATYTITQADVDAGSVRNTAVGTATTPAGAVLSVPSSQSVIATAVAAPAVNLTKSGSLAPGSTGRAGDVVTYSFRLVNSGNVTLTAAAITDPLPGLSALTYSWPATPGTLAPGQAVTATATYVLKQSDVDAGSLANSATATARPPVGAVVTQTRSATVPIAPASALTVLKSGSVTSGTGAVGSTVTYTFSATNSGNVTLSQVVIADPLAGLSAISYTWPGTAGTLAPGQTVQATATYTVRQADVDAGAVTNTATASGRTPTGTTITGASPTTRVVTAAASPSSTTIKTAAVSGSGAVGDVITYTVRTTNSGNVTLTGVTVADALPGLSGFTFSWPGTPGRLAPGQTVTGVATYTIRQADVDAGAVRNIASSTASHGATTVTSGSGEVVTPTVAAAPGIVTTKSGRLQSGSAGSAGDSILWTITLRNSGNVTLSAASIADSLPGISVPTYGTWPSGTAGVLRPGDTVTVTATSTISQSDVNSGAVTNTATGSGLPPVGPAVTSTAPATVSLASAPGLALVKTGTVTAGNGGVGSTITYSFTARNTGNVTLTGVAIDDPHAGLSALAYTWPGPAGTLQPNQIVTATATYSIRQSDVDAGAARNTASVTGTPPSGPGVTVSSGEISVPTIAASPAISTTKTAAGAGGGVGSVITYTFRATNTGNVTLTGVVIADPLPRLGTLEYTWPGTSGRLAPGETVTATAPYTLTQADIDAGSVTNTSTAQGTGGGTTVRASSGAVVTPTAAGAPAITVTKAGTLSGSGTAGDTISYAFTVRNSGNVTLSGVALVDPLIGTAPVALTGWPGTAGTLAPGQSVTGMATYTVRQSDVDAGAVANTATATGTPPRGAAVSGTAPSTVPVAAVPAIAVTKSGAVTAGNGGVGSTITFEILIRNSGNVTLSGVALTDSLAGLSTPVVSWPGTPNVLTPGQTATATATYTVRQADVDAGAVRNTASASGRPPTGPVVSATSTQAVVPTVTAAPALAVTKSAASGAGGRVGDVVSYSIRVENTGNQTVTGVTISDPLPGLSGLSITWPGSAGVLAPGQAAVARGTYTITQTDVNAGSITNRASASGTAPGGVAVSAQSAPAVTATIAAAPQLAATKTVALAPGATGRAGDITNYTIAVRNSGNVTLTGVAVTDALAGLSPLTYSWPAAQGVLQPGQTVLATATRALTQSDVDAGSVANTATAVGTPPSGPAVQQSAAATLPLTSGPAVTIAKTGAYSTGSGAVGSVITYTFTARNTGNVTLGGVTIADARPGLSPIALTWPGTAGTLAPGAVVTGTATYTVTQADVDAGRVVNTASVTGTPPSGPAVGATSSTVILATVAAGPGLATVKSATVTGTGAVGDVVTYTVRATNSGNVTLRGVTVVDPLPGLTPFTYTWPAEAGVLAPGAGVTAIATRTITQADVDRGTLVNVATTNATAPNGSPVSAASATVTTPTVAAAPQLQVSKSGTLPAGASGIAGETITWTVTLRNTGNVTLTGVSATDSLPGISELTYGSWPSSVAGTLAPGNAVTATATSVVRQSDVDAGSVANTASASGTPARGQAASGVGSATVPLASAPAIAIDKSGAYTVGSGAVGDTITYRYTVRNSGNVTLTGVAIADPHAGLSAIAYGTWPSGTAGTLAPNQAVTATATYQVRQSDVNAGSITDTATATGRPPAGAPVSATSATVVLPTSGAAPSILTTKTAAVGGSGSVGDLVTYTLRAANTGNVTLTGVEITDPAPGLSPLSYGPWPAATGTLQPGQSITATATHRITQADLDAGAIVNTATSTGTPPAGPAVTDPSETISTSTAAQAPDVQVTKTGVLAPGSTGRAGDTVNFSFSLRNTGNVTLGAVSLTDQVQGVSPLAYTWPGAPGVLAPNQVVTATATYTLTQTDVDAGGVVNTVTGAATPPSGVAFSEDAFVTVPVTAAPSLIVTKTGTVVGDGEAGSSIRFDFTLTNTGNVTVSGITLADSIPGLVPAIAWPGAAGTLAPGQRATATAEYEIVQADVDAGSVSNTATVAGTTPGGVAVQAQDDVTVATGTQRADITLAKVGAALPGQAGVGDTITYTFTLTNTGNVTVTEVAVVDDRADVELSDAQWPTIAPGDSVSATGTYVITQADVDAGRVVNTATATGSSPIGAVTTRSDESVVVVEATSPALAVSDSGSLPAGAVAGSSVTWTYTLTNTGNVTLSGVGLTDALPGTSAPDYDWTSTVGELAPGDVVTATATTVLTQADVDAGAIVSVVTGRGTPPTGPQVSATASATVPIPAAAAVTLDKSANRTTGLAAGETITFAFDIRNAGAVTLDGIALSDLLPGLSPITFGPWPGGTAGRLAPGEIVTATADYVVTQADVDRGIIENTSTVTGRPPTGARVQATDTVDLATVTAAPALALTKEGPSDAVAAGDSVRYAFTVENTGNVTLTGVGITDPLPGLSAVGFGAWPSGEPGVLAPGQRVSAAAQYTVAQADVDRGALTNEATATGTSPSGAEVADTATVTTSAVAAAPSVAVTKIGTLAAGATGRAGDAVDYRFTATNTGNVTITSVDFDDSLAGLSPISVTWPGEPGVLALGQVATAVAGYTLTQADVDAGAVSNTVVVDGAPARGDLPAEEQRRASATVPIAPGASLTAVKTGVLTGGGIGQVGDVIQYEIVATNTGNVTISEGGLIDPMPGLYDISIAWSGTPGELEVGDSVTGRGKYRITQADVDAGSVRNTGTVGGSTPAGVPVQVSTNTVVVNTVLPAPGLAVTKSGTTTGSGGVGDEVEYEFGITNSGNVTLSGVTLADPLPGVALSTITWPAADAPGVIAPGQTATASGTLEITQADVDAGRVVNVATATGTPPRGPAVSAESDPNVVLTVAAAPALVLSNSGAFAPGATGRAGDVVTWTYVLTNSGNVTVNSVSLADALPNVGAPEYLWGNQPGVLAPGQTVTATATYTLTQADVDSGSVTSVVTGTGTPDVGAAVVVSAPATLAIGRVPALSVTKDAVATGGAVGDTIGYSFAIENRGNVTLTGVGLSDSLPGLSTAEIVWPGEPGTLAPAAVATATAQYTITQADVDAGRVVNTATSTASAPGGESITASSGEVITPTDAATPAMTTSKSAVVGGSGTGVAGDTVAYTIAVRNTGNVTLDGVAVADELEGLSAPRLSWPGDEGVLLPDATLTATAVYVITQADVDRGTITNSATSSGTTPSGTAVDSASAPVVVSTVAAAPNASLTKTGTLRAGATGEVGDVVEYSVRVENTGNVTLDAITLDDPLVGISDFDFSWPAAEGTLAPGAVAIATATYPLTQADIDAGEVRNTVTMDALPARDEQLQRSSSATVTVPQTGALSAVKSGVLLDGGIGQVGDVIQYEVTVTNTGNVTVVNGTLVDPMAGLFDLTIAWPDPTQPGRLEVDGSVTGRAKYRLTQADVDRGFVTNTATVGADAPNGRVESDTNTVVINTVQPAASLLVAKSGIVGGDGGVGAPVNYAFTITNTGNVTVSGVTLADPLPGLSTPAIAWPGEPGVLSPGQSAQATAQYTITLADVDAGAVSNAATATGSSRGGVVTSPPAIATVPTQGVQATITVDKTAALRPGAVGIAGDMVDWAYTLQNTGNVTLTGVTLTDGLAGSTPTVYVWPDPARPGVLLPGQVVTASSTYELTQQDVDRGIVSSAVDGTAVPPRGAAISESATASVVIAARPALVAMKTGTVDGAGDVGDTIDYDFVVENTGNVTLTLVDLIDALPGVSAPSFEWPGEPGVLAPGDSVTATAAYEITQTDVDRGSVSNTATASGKPPVGDTISTTTPATITLVAAADPSLTVRKTASVDGDREVGDLVSYAFTVENTGNVTLDAVALADPLPGLSVPVVLWPAEPGVLAPGQIATATADYQIAQADVDRGQITNTATVDGRTPSGAGVSGASDEVVTPTADAAAALVVEKSGALEAGGIGEVGELITFAFTLRNTGNQTLSAVTLDDELPGISEIEITWPSGDPAAAGILPVGASASGTATYALTQQDIDAGAVSNVVTARAVPSRGPALSPTDSATVLVPQTGGLSAVKTGELLDGGIGQVGDVIQYQIVATNTGNVTITEGGLVDPMPGLYDVSIAWSGTPGQLDVGDSVTGRGKYRITQADVDAGFVENTGSVGGRTPDGTLVEVDTNTVVIDTVLPAPALLVTKSGDATGVGGVGDEIEYEFGMTNTGNVTLSSLALTDPLPGLSTPVVDWPGAPGVLAPGETATATARYPIAQADVDAGAVRNVATAGGTTPRGESVTADSPPSVVETQSSTPAVTVTDSGALEAGASGAAGDRVIWTYTLTNTGNVTLGSVAFDDALAGVGAPAYTWPGTPGELAPGQTVIAQAEYRLTQADVDAGAVTSLVAGSGYPAVGAPATATAPATVLIAASASLSFQKTGVLDAVGENDLGDDVTFGFRIENTGTVTLSDIAVSDPLTGIGPIRITWPGTAGVLAPGQVATGTAAYDITQQDVDRGQVENTASVRAAPPTGTTLEATSTMDPIPTADQEPSITTLKNGAYLEGDGGVGSVIEYDFVVTNTGNVTLSLIRVQDDLVGVSTPALEFPAATGILAPGASATGTARYTVTQADVDAGSITNLATSYGTSPRGDVVSGASDAVVIDAEPQVPADEAIETTQSARLATGDTGATGDSIEYTFAVRNTGNTTLDDVSLSNTLAGLEGFAYTWPDPANPGRLLPGQEVIITATYTVTQADVDAGEVRNVATGSGERPRGDSVSDTSAQSVVRLADAPGALQVTKVGTRSGDGSTGSVVDYVFTVVNAGDVTLTDVELTDPLSGLSEIVYGTWPGNAGRLAPGESVTATASYVIRQADVDRGAVRNVASATGTTPGGASVAADSPESVVLTVAAAARIDLVKSQRISDGATGRPGDRVIFEFTITNDGNVTLGGVTLGDGQAGLSGIRITWPGADGVLAPGAVAAGVAEYTLTQADVDAGGIASTASVSGNGGGIIVTDTADGATEVLAAPSLSLEKSAQLETVAQQGAGVHYTITVVNTGNVTLSGVDVTDALEGLGSPSVVWPGTPGVLRSGESAVFTARYVIGQADVDRGFVDNTAEAVGAAPDGTVVADSDAVRVPVPSSSAIDLTMNISIADGQAGRAGDTLVFDYTATNTGTTTLTGVVITDLHPGLSDLTYTWPGAPGVLLPGQSVTATATLTITAAMEGTVIASRAVVTSMEAGGGTQVVAVASDSIALPAPEPTGILPTTGSDPAALVGAAGMLLIAGLVLLIGTRRRHHQHS